LATAQRLGVSIKAVWLTHSHLDHCGGVAPLLESLKVPLVANPEERMMRSNVQSIAQMYGMSPAQWHNCPEPTVNVQGGETLSIGNSSCVVLFTPGHSPGHVSYFFEKDHILASGDVLFAGSIGRTDLPGGDTETLLDAIRREVFTLPPDTRVLTGHGPDTTVGEEKASNPFFTGAQYD
jgi:glyoxylase-like metal-dependent hydrolase (beta-lactamase superfamily II)